MGQWFARSLSKEGKQIVISGRDQARLKETAGQLGVESAPAGEAVEMSDAVILSVPIDKFETAVRQIAPHTHAGQYVFDITSIKARPVEIMHEYIRKGTILGMHPMFGPGAGGIKGQRFVLTPTDSKEEKLANKTKKYLEERGAKVALMTPGEHDETMSIVLGLSHFIALVSADTLASLGNLQKAREINGTSYRLLLTLAEEVVSEDPEFYSSLQMNLPGLAGIEKLFHSKAGEWASIVGHGDREEFAKRMRVLKIGFEKEDPGFATAYKNMYKLIGE